MRERIARAYDWKSVLGMAVLALAYLASARLGLSLATVHGNVSPVWPPTAVAIAGLMVLGVRAWPAVLVGGLLAILPSPAPLLACLGMSVGNTLEAVTAVLLLRRVGFSPELARIRDVVALGLGAAGCTLVSTLVGVLCLCLSGTAEWARFGHLAWTWWVGNAIGAVVLTPVLLMLPRLQAVRRRGEAVLLAALVLLVCLVLFNSGRTHPGLALAEVFLLFPLSTWAALRFGTQGAAAATLVIAAAAISGTALGLGPFAAEGRVDDLLVLQLFLGVTALTGLLLAAASAERQGAMQRLELMAATVRAVGEGVLISERQPDGSLRIVHPNEAFCGMLGYTREELMGRPPRELAAPDGASAETVARLDEAIAGRGAFRAEVVLAHKDGRHVFSDMQLSLVRGADGAVTHAVSTHRDVTETKELQARLLAAERFAAVGTLAAGVGHEINNPLAYLVLSLEAAAKALTEGGGAEALAGVRGAQEGAERIRLLVRDLKTFSREAREERAVVDLREVVAPALRMTRHALRGRARLVEEYGPVPRVEGSEARLVQVLLNLLVNAVQAIPEGDAERHEVRVRTGTDGEGRAWVEVSDTGRGIPAHVLPRIFDPFFTTKENGEGTGLGLALCQQMVKAHGGEMRVRSEVGRGTTFTVLLPPASEEALRAASACACACACEGERECGGPPEEARRGRILVIDDEPRLAQSMRLLLEPAHEVVTTTCGREALAWLSSGQRFDVVLCDLQMPETSGMDVYARLRERAPELARRLVFLSGGAYTPAAREFIRSVPNRVLEKPVRPEALLAAIDAALA